MQNLTKYIKWFEEISLKDIPTVGGKTASLGEMYQALGSEGILVPQGFAVSADAYTALITQNNISKTIYHLLQDLNTQDTTRLANTGKEIRNLIRTTGIPTDVALEIRTAYKELCRRARSTRLDVAVRSSATAEDLPSASFAGQQETFLNISGEEDLLVACVNCFASLFTDRAISYRVTKGFKHSQVKLSVCIQQMIRSDLASSGVMFTLDTESGARNVVMINSAYGLGENIVGGKVDPDEFYVLKELVGKDYKPILRRKVGLKQQRMVYETHGSRSTKNVEVSKLEAAKLSLTDTEVLTLARWGIAIEKHYSKLHDQNTPMDIEWGKDGLTNQLYILQARPETVHSQTSVTSQISYSLKQKSKVLLTGKAVGSKIGAGPVRIITSVADLNQFQENEVLVADMTDPDWEPIMKKASAIVTNRGGRTCHAAIVSREHGVPCVVGTGVGTALLKTGQKITVSCAEGDDGLIMDGILSFEEKTNDWTELKKTRTKIMVNLGNPGHALKASRLPVDGVGLARIEFIISEYVKIHPMALVHLENISDPAVKNKIEDMLGDLRKNPEQYFINQLVEGVSLIAGAFYPRPVVIRFSDFKTNEYASLLGGAQFEPQEENPMIGFRGASRYYDPRYREGFALECKAIKYLREVVGLKNIKVMIPFCRSTIEGEKVLLEMASHGLIRGENDLEVLIMSELPANVLRAEEFGKLFDGFSIGSNDLTQMTLGVDRDSEVISHLFNERDPAVLKMLHLAIAGAKKSNRPIGICGQAPSDYPEICDFLISEGITSISVTPDAVLNTIKTIIRKENL